MLRFTLHLAIVAALCVAPQVQADEPISADSVVKAEKLRLDALRAAQRGDFQVAADRIASAADLSGNSRVAEQARQLAPASNAGGGGAQANFDELIQLIVSQTVDEDNTVWGPAQGGTGVGSITPSFNGVLFALNSVAKTVAVEQSVSRLQSVAEIAKSANQNTDVRQSSEMRMVSLPRLERHVRQLAAAGKEIPEDLMALAGITEIKYMFVFPETQDIVIAGPAGAWTKDGEGRRVSTESGRPTLNLDDLIVLNRTFSRGGAGFFMCSIDPRQAQIAAVQSFVAKNRNGLSSRTAKRFTEQLEETLGLQDVVVQGIPQDSHVASVIVDADYRMKEIGIGRRKGPAGMKSYFDLLTRAEQRGSGSMDALRWWMALGYDGINMSPNGQVFEFAGEAVECLSENQLVAQNGTRQSTGNADRANAKFAALFTKHLPELASQDPVFAELQNVFDLAIVSAMVHANGAGAQANWTAETFRNPNAVKHGSVDVPEELMTAAAYRVYRGGSVVIQVAGGVKVDVSSLVGRGARMNSVPALDTKVLTATPIGQDINRWWWDAAEK